MRSGASSTARVSSAEPLVVVEREEPVALVYDEECSRLVKDAGGGRKRSIARCEGPEKPDCAAIEDLIASGDKSEPKPPQA